MSDERDSLFDLPPGEFTKARNDLAARLRKDGRKEDADAVRGLRKPSLSAWATNQVARRHGDDMASFLEVSEALRAAQKDLLAGGDPGALRDATKARRDGARRLTDVAAGILQEEGTAPSRTHLDRVTANLMAAATDESAVDLLRSGTLTEDLRPPTEDLGFGGFGAVAAEPPARSRKATAGARKRAEKLAKAADDAEALARELHDEASAAQRAAEEIRMRASDARRAAAEARARADKAMREI